MTMMIMMIIITFCALDILILEFLPCKWQLVWNMLIKIIIIRIITLIIIIIIIIIIIMIGQHYKIDTTKLKSANKVKTAQHAVRVQTALGWITVTQGQTYCTSPQEHKAL